MVTLSSTPGRRFAAIGGAWLLTLLLPCARAGEPIIPPVSGEVSGDFTWFQSPGELSLHWTVALSTTAANQRVGRLTVTGASMKVTAELQVDAAGDGTWQMRDTHVDLKPWFNGTVTRGQAVLSGHGKIEHGQFTGGLTLKLSDVDLGELTQFADGEKKYVQKAEGRVEGTIRIHLNESGVSAGSSTLSLPADSVGRIQFVPSPGLLTDYVPAEVLKHYPGIRAIEMGVTPLEAKVLTVTYTPKNEKGGNGAMLRIEGRPLDPKIIAPLVLEVNFNGPLEKLVRQTLDSRLSFGK